MKSSILVAAATATCAHAFAPTASNFRPSVSTNMALIDGVKKAFGGDGKGDLGSERETPIDRWMGWNTKTEQPQGSVAKAADDFIDSMDGENYVTATLIKPMGIVFEENDSDVGGIFALDVSEGSNAETDGTIKPGDQLVSVGGTKVTGLPFEEALGTVIDNTDSEIKMVFFRGASKFLYGPAGASQDWLDTFIKGE